MDTDSNNIYLLNSDRPFHYFVSGKYIAKAGWKHERSMLSENYELVIGIKGKAFITINGNDHILQKGTCLLFPQNASVEGYKKSDTDIEFYWFHFFPKDEHKKITVEELDDSLGDSNKLSKIINYAILPEEYSIEEFDKILTSANETLALSQELNYTDAIMSYAVTKLVLQISNDYINSLHKLVAENPKAHMIKDWIKANLNSNLSVKDVAANFDFNYRYLSRLLKAETGFTVENYILFLKINIAKRLLLESNLPLKVISDRAYFNDEKYFLRLFKKKVGITPTSYRKNFMKEFLINGKTDKDN
ncbi:AraC family transcriptional regulator [Secundilactobacillus pentosiphilus]|uniref:AraC family transcriptional regulator n=1 Tax=Secundilactobacillus pentosiphilus TaxID=1714682 RepID=A0A1Z5IMP7_9LACO|nr:AraC family transcriptional regulator [Secundilactobacillus pentosiphilus]GAX03034.1 AraC family transcriptional regulator [Secundilactobacillus pentosiphilus]